MISLLFIPIYDLLARVKTNSFIMLDFFQARQAMVTHQLQPYGVRDPKILHAFSLVPREAFLPRELKGIAYCDAHLHFENGRFLLAPALLARIIEGLKIKFADTVLHVGCGRGYFTKILAYLSHRIVALEKSKEFYDTLKIDFPQNNDWNVQVVHQKHLLKGDPNQGGYDVILVEGGVSSRPSQLLKQLKEGGRLGMICKQGAGKGVVYKRLGDEFSCEILCNGTAPLLEQDGFSSSPHPL